MIELAGPNPDVAEAVVTAFSGAFLLGLVGLVAWCAYDWWRGDR